MNQELETSIQIICKRYGDDPTRMMDIVRDVQRAMGFVPGAAMDAIARAVGSHRVEVESVVSFYSFFTDEEKGRVVIRVSDDVVDRLKGYDVVMKAFEEELGIAVGETTADGAITLERTACIGMSDQAPAAMVNDVVVTDLCPDRARKIARALLDGAGASKIGGEVGDGNNAHELVRASVRNNLRKAGPVLFEKYDLGLPLHKALSMSPVEVIREVKTARLRGRGGAGFPTGLKWEFARAAQAERKFILCNADEGEPGTFKDRVILTESPDLLMEGMTIAGYALGADTGIIYLRGEYMYLKAFLEDIIARRKAAGLLGDDIHGKGFGFDIRIQMGAGAYVCGEETALISSCEGLRGDPKNRPPFPAQKGYLGYPTTVNNVETLCCVARVLCHGAGWFAEMGSETTAGTKALSISGDCDKPGVYELPFGVTVRDLLAECGASDAAAVQVGGPSGRLIGPKEYDRKICFDDLGTGGSIVVFGKERSIPEIAKWFMEFFVDESCGYCTPCRVGNSLLLKKLEEVIDGKGAPEDLAYLEDLGRVVRAASRCGLGQTSPNPILTSLENFRPAYEDLVKGAQEGPMKASFDLDSALRTGAAAAGRDYVPGGGREGR